MGDEDRCPISRTNASDMKPEQVVQANLDAYNARDLDEFMFWFADFAEMAEFGGTERVNQRAVAIRERYKPRTSRTSRGQVFHYHI